ncbi:MAG: FIMAH domain-containing protein [Gammaproteobacteria bacterium]
MTSPEFEGTIRIGIDQPPRNDGFGGAIALPRWSGGVFGRDLTSTTTGSLRFATRQAEEPVHTGGGGTVWFTYVAPGNGTATVDTCGSEYATNVSVYVGGAIDTLTGIPATSAASCSGPGQQLTFDAAYGKLYRFVVEVASGASAGGYVITVDGTNAVLPNDDFADAIDLSGPLPVKTLGATNLATSEPGEPNHGTLTNIEKRTIWYSYTAAADGALRIDTCGSSYPTRLAVYTGDAVDALTHLEDNAIAPASSRCARSRQSSVVIAGHAGTTYRIAISGQDDGASNPTYVGVVHLRIEDPGFPANDDAANAFLLTGPEDGDIVSSRGATSQSEEPAHAGEPAVASVWWEWFASDSGTITVDTCGSDHPTRLGVYLNRRLAAMEEVAAATAGTGCDANAASTTFVVRGGEFLRFAVDGVDGATGTTALNLSLEPEPSPWDPKQVLSDPAHVANEGAIEARSDGTFVTAWSNLTDEGPLAPNFFFDTGFQVRTVAADGTFGPINSIPTSDWVTKILLAARVDGTTVVSWTEGYLDAGRFVEAIHLGILGPDGTLVGPAMVISDGQGQVIDQYLYTGPDGSATVVWNESTALNIANVAYNFQVRARTLEADGTLDARQDLSEPSPNDDGLGAAHVAVAVLADGSAYLVWQNQLYEPPFLDRRFEFVHRSPDGITTPVTIIAHNAVDGFNVAPGPGIDATFVSNDRSTSVELRRLFTNGMFTDPIAVVDTANLPTEVGAAVDSRGITTVVWAQRSPEIPQGAAVWIRQIDNFGAPRGPAVRVGPYGLFALPDPTLVVASDDTVYVGWVTYEVFDEDNVAGSVTLPGPVYVATITPDGEVGLPAELGGENRTGRSPKLAVGADGTVTAMWLDDGVAAGTTDYQFNVAQLRAEEHQPPVADAGGPYIAECRDAEDGGTTVILDGSASFDPDGDPLAFVWSATQGNLVAPSLVQPTLDVTSVALGSIIDVTLEVYDGFASDTDNSTVTVQDTASPIPSCPGDIVEEPTSPAGNTVTFTATAADACEANPTLVSSPVSGSQFAVGTTTEVTVSATDADGNSAMCTFTVKILSVDELAAKLGAKVEQLSADGEINQGVANALLTILRNVESSLARSDTGAACNQLADFIATVQDQVDSGKLATEEARALIDSANNLRATLGC